MAEYLSPDVYVEDIPSAPVIEQVSSSTGGFVGTAQRGKVGKPTFLTSWNDYLTKFAGGMPTPFMTKSDLAYAVYGFFQNGGKRCYVQRVAGKSAKAATMSATGGFFDEGEDNAVLEARDEGAWGNDLTVKVTANVLDESLFDITVSLRGDLVESFTGLNNDSESSDYWIDTININSQFLTAISGEIKTTLKDITFELGADDLEGVSDTTYTESLANFDTVDDMTLLCIPGQTSKTVMDALMTYCVNRQYIFCILDAPRASDTQSVIELRKQLSCPNAAIYYPSYIKVSDPLSTVGKLRECPASGHIMGVYARTIQERGVHKAPAGTEAIIRGAIEIVTTLTKGDCDVLNPMNINAVMPKPNYGIVIWGARCLNPDSSMKYVSDMLLDINIKKSTYLGTQPFVFEPNSHETWVKVETTIQAFLDNLWRDGALFGETPSQAYFVKCDESLNPENVRNAGKMITEIGYASKKPAEFVIFRFTHTVASE